MSAIPLGSFVSKIYAEVNVLLNSYVYNGYNAVSHYMTVPLGLIATISLVIVGYCIANGLIKMEWSTFFKLLIKIAVVYTLVLNWGFVSEYIVDGTQAIIAGVGDTLMKVTPIQIPGVATLAAGLQTTLTQTTMISGKVMAMGGITHPLHWLVGFFMWALGLLTIGIALFELILAQIMLAIYIVFIPIIAPTAFFEKTKSMCDGLFKGIVTMVLLQLFVTAALGFTLSITYFWAGLITAESIAKMGYYGATAGVILSVISIGLLLKAGAMAQSIGGSVSASGSSMMAAIGGAAFGYGMAAMSAGKKGGGLLKRMLGGVPNVSGKGGSGGSGLFDSGSGGLAEKLESSLNQPLGDAESKATANMQDNPTSSMENPAAAPAPEPSQGAEQ